MDISQELLAELFSPPPVYQDLPGTVAHVDPGDVNWKSQVEDVLDRLRIDIEIDRQTSREYPDASADAQINPRERVAAAEHLAQTGHEWASAMRRVRSELLDGLLSDLRRVVTPLMQPQNAHLRAQVEQVPSQWMACVGTCGAFGQFLDLACKEWNAEGFAWFMQHADPPAHEGVGLVEAVGVLSQKTIDPSHGFPMDYATAVINWCARSRFWKTTPDIAGIHLAQALCNPGTGIGELLAEKGSRLAWDKISWQTAVRHAQKVPSGRNIEEHHVADFLEAHVQALVASFPLHARGQSQSVLPGVKNGVGMVRLARPDSLAGLAEIVSAPERRQKLLADIEGALLSLETPDPRGKRKSLRL